MVKRRFMRGKVRFKDMGRLLWGSILMVLQKLFDVMTPPKGMPSSVSRSVGVSK
jgi:hypothetical protein